VSDPRPDAIRRLGDAGVGNPRLDARLLWDAAQRNPGIFESFIKRRIAREPVAYITGAKEFWSLELAVGPGVLIPRPDTETVIEEVLDRFPGSSAPLKILDLGTGSGCLLVTLLKEYPNARGLGIDESEQALAIAAGNIARHGLENRADLRRGNWMDGLTESWDVIVSNPPYIPTADIAGLEADVRDYEPRGALDGGADGLDAVRALAKALRGTRFTAAFVEIGVGQGESAKLLMAAEGLSVHHVAADLAGIPRVLVTGPAPAAASKKELE
jgi:release factor glutamine methyltransferase